MNVIFHNQDFDKDMLDKFSEACNKDESPISIYLKSDGGFVSVLDAMLHIVNSNPQRFTLIGFYNLYSCAFEFYMKAKCKKELLPNTMGMFHLSNRDITINECNKTTSEGDKANIDKMKKYDLPSTKKFMEDCGFTEKEVKKVLSGKDLYIQFDRMLEMENYYNSETINNNQKFEV